MANDEGDNSVKIEGFSSNRKSYLEDKTIDDIYFLHNYIIENTVHTMFRIKVYESFQILQDFEESKVQKRKTIYFFMSSVTICILC